MAPAIPAALAVLAELIRRRVPDADTQAELIAQIEAAALATPTHPFFDGFHKIGRQLTGLAIVAAVVYLKINGLTLTLDEIGALVGVPTLYSLMKGKGR